MTVLLGKWDDLRGHPLWRPILVLSHILLIVLVTCGSQDDRIWNQRVDGRLSFPSAASIYNCSFQTNSFCCQPRPLNDLTNLYKDDQYQRHSLFYVEVLVYLSTFSVTLCLFSCLMELNLLKKIDTKHYFHRLVNTMGGCFYIISLFLLSQGIVEIKPTSNTQAELCGDLNRKYKHVPEIVKAISTCYARLGACRCKVKDALSVALVFMTLFPFLCVLCYFLASVFTCGFEFDEDENRNQIAGPNPKGQAKVKGRVAVTNKKHRTTGHTTVNMFPTITNATTTTTSSLMNNGTGIGISKNKSNPKADLRLLLSQLETNPSCRVNEGYLARLGKTFKNYIRSGYTLTLLPVVRGGSRGGASSSIILPMTSKIISHCPVAVQPVRVINTASGHPHNNTKILPNAGIRTGTGTLHTVPTSTGIKIDHSNKINRNDDDASISLKIGMKSQPQAPSQSSSSKTSTNMDNSDKDNIFPFAYTKDFADLSLPELPPSYNESLSSNII